MWIKSKINLLITASSTSETSETSESASVVPSLTSGFFFCFGALEVPDDETKQGTS
jgi:hypothetical protein